MGETASLDPPSWSAAIRLREEPMAAAGCDHPASEFRAGRQFLAELERLYQKASAPESLSELLESTGRDRLDADVRSVVSAGADPDAHALRGPVPPTATDQKGQE